VTELPLPEYRIPVGALPGGTYRALEVVVAPGDVVLGYSDGVTDARSPAGEFFGSERLQDVVARASGDPRRLIRDVLDAVEAFTESGAQFDDLTLVAVGRRTEDG
jgi:serine phosphatase RsbU (regulator of sigma subunit)